MTYLLDDLLDTARIEEGKLRLSLEPLDLRAVVERAIDQVRPLIEMRRQRLEASLDPGPLPMEADGTRLEQVLVNLLTNAAKYTDPGGNIWLSAERQDGQMVVRVRDDGRGLAPEVLPRLFDLFSQAEAGSYGGLGVGLFLVRRLVEMHGGNVAASSAGPRRGSEFVVRLPQARLGTSS